MKVLASNIFFFIFLLTSTTFLSAQSSLISVDFQNEKIATILLDIAAEYRYDIFFHESYFDSYPVKTIQLQNKSIAEVLREVLKGTKVDFKIRGKKIELTKLRTVYGYIRDDLDHEGLINVAIYHRERMMGTYTNEYGYFSLTIPYELDELTTQYVGYLPQKIQLQEVDQAITIYLKFEEIKKKEIVVLSKDVKDGLAQNVDGVNILPQEIGGYLSTGGEPDINQHLYKQTGVSAGPDGLGGLHVRGGNSSQNLFLLDGVRIFQPNHAFGLFSIFNTPLLKNAKFSKYNFHPKYSGGVSSVVNMTLKEGSTKKWNGTFSTSTLASQISINGPIIRNKTSLLLSFRRSHLDPILQGISSRNRSQFAGEDGYLNFSFYDVNAKLHHILGKRDKIYLSYYRGKDKYEDERSLYIDDSKPGERFIIDSESYTQFDWMNEILALRWNHLFGDRMFSSTTFSISNFKYQSRAENRSEIIDDLFNQEINEYFFNGFISKNREFGFRYDVEHFPSDKIQNSFGITFHHTQFLPGALSNTLSGDSIVIPLPSDEIIIEEYLTNSYRQNHLAIYANRKMKLSDNLTLNLGGKYGWLTSNNLLDSITSQFHLWNARVALDYKLNKKTRILLSGTKSDQEFHLLTTADIGLPNDLWVPAIENAKPQTTYQGNLFVQYQPIRRLKIGTSLFYRKMENLIRLPSEIALPEIGTNISTFWENEVWIGGGTSKGIEVDIEYKSPKLDFNLAYTWSDYKRSFDSIDGGKPYPFVFDQTHNISFDVKYKLNHQLAFYTHFIFNNGMRQTYFSSMIPVEPFTVFPPLIEEQLSRINDHRLPNYQRVDVGLIFNFGKKLKHELTVGAQNVFNRRNVYFEYQLTSFEGEGEHVQIKAFPILPLLRYSLKF